MSIRKAQNDESGEDQHRWVFIQYADGKTHERYQGDWTELNGVQTIEGLARLSKPRGTFLEYNTPDQDKWFSADLPVMSATKDVDANTAYYIAADRTGDWRVVFWSSLSIATPI